jgi:hypothetical protein
MADRSRRAPARQEQPVGVNNSNFSNWVWSAKKKVAWIKGAKNYERVIATHPQSKMAKIFLQRVAANENFAQNHNKEAAAAGKNTGGNLKARVVAGAAKEAANSNRTGLYPGQEHWPAALRHAGLSFRPMFSMAQLQSWSGSVLETRAIEYAALKGKVRCVKFNRKEQRLGGASQIFEVKERTFFFKPRFSLNPIKNDPNPNWTSVMAEVVAKTGGGAGKGVNDVETDVIEAFPRGYKDEFGNIYPNGLIRLYECKIGLGKPEGSAKAGESLQLMKAKRLLNIYWETLMGGDVATIGYPAIKCYFLAWKFGETSTGGLVVTNVPVKKINVADPTIEFVHHRGPFPALSNKLRTAAGETPRNTANNSTNSMKHWDDVKTLNPTGFANLTGLDPGFVESYLVHHRSEIFQYFTMLMKTLIQRGALTAGLNNEKRRALLTNTAFVSGSGTTLYPPQGPNKALQHRLKGQLANYMNMWTPNFYSHMAPNNRAKAIANNQRYFAAKATRAMARLVQQGVISVRENGESINNLPNYSASELNRPTNNTPTKRFTNQSNINEYRRRINIAIKRANNLLPKSAKSFFKHIEVENLGGGVRGPPNRGVSSEAARKVAANIALFKTNPVAALNKLVRNHLNNNGYLQNVRAKIQVAYPNTGGAMFNTYVGRKKMGINIKREP